MDYEKLGAFYLGREHDLDSGEDLDTPLLYDARDLCTHAVCVGMTGSGKTGLCIGLLEEAAIDGIPALVIDPKGDLGNLMLTFPELSAKEFEPWVNADDARRKNLGLSEFAAAQATLWREGLASWGQDGERIRRLKAAAEFEIYTPGSRAGTPISIVSSFAAPPREVIDDGDLLRDRIEATATSLLGLLDVDADPITSREHILLSNLFDHAWRAGRALDLGGLIQLIQQPPMQRVGVMDMESFFPAKDRFGLAMRLNNLLAAPGFASWMEGEPLDIGRLLYTDEGKPRVSIVSIAHLSDAERMFFVSMLLNQTLAWVRSQTGTTSLRALLYMDEIFGFMPPIGEPPSKKPLLTLLKQARAYGLGVVLATQNPVDLDYKGLSNTGTWFLGRLQTERDKARVLDGLEGASGKFDRPKMERTLAGLGKRVFLMHNVHETAPVTFRTRWVMSYLRGPLTREHIKRLSQRKRPAPKPERAQPAAAAMAPAAPVATNAKQAEAATRALAALTPPLLPPSVEQRWLPLSSLGATGVRYDPGLIGLARVQFVDRKSKKKLKTEEFTLFAPFDRRGDLDWAEAARLELAHRDVLDAPPAPASAYGDLPDDAGSARAYSGWTRELSDWLYRNSACEVLTSPTFKLSSKPDETERDFRIRLGELGRERRDRQVAKLRKKYATKEKRLAERIRRAETKISKEEEQASSQKMQTAISFGATLLSAFLGRKAVSAGSVGKATTTLRGAQRAARERGDVKRAQRDYEALLEQREALGRELEDETDALDERFDPANEQLERAALRPRRSDVDVRLVALGWRPDA